MARENFASNSPFEAIVGFSRAVRVGNQVFVAGTVGRGADGNVVEGGVYEQARQVIANIEAVLKQAGASLGDVVRTRIYVVDVDTQDEVSRAHLEAFGEIRPASTLVEVSRLATPSMLVEMEADAVVDA
jgi:enamine deaminase RidA (YjgF/YER057c/UK114 family)